MRRKFFSRTLLGIAIISTALFVISCAEENSNKPASPSPVNSSVQASPAPPKTGFEADLDYVRKGQYTYIWVFSRKDGKPLDKDDSAFLRKNAPQVVDWVTTNEGKQVIAGTNFDLEQGNLGLLQKRFVVEDYTGR